jgi:spore maturation protein CgeB
VVNIPTGCFQIDTFSGTQKRIKWSMLFDYVFVFHPKFDKMFEKAGHPNAVFLPHAVEANLFNGSELERIYEVGWVGNLKSSHGYNKRREVIEDLASSFSMNDVNKYYDPKSMAEIYKQSKIVVNISRDDYLQDANLRCFEVMAGGSLLITRKPTELEDIGFIEGTHYITYTKYSEIKNLVNFYLLNEEKRLAITQKAKHLVLSEHTYSCRAQQIISLIDSNRKKLFAPARNWNKLKVHQVYFHFFSKHLMLDSALAELKIIFRISRSQALLQLPLFIKCKIFSFPSSSYGICSPITYL